jgi:hypothetical protein
MYDKCRIQNKFKYLSCNVKMSSRLVFENTFLYDKRTTYIYIDKKKKIRFSSYIRKFSWDRLQSHIRGRTSLIYEEMRKYLVIYEEIVSHI